MNFIYNNSPVLLQSIFTSIYGYKIKRERYNKEYINYFNLLKKEAVNQENELEKLLFHLKKYINFYDDYLEDIDLENSSAFEVLKTLPIIDKKTIRNNIDQFTLDKKSGITFKTGGTTGEPLTVYFSKEDIAKRTAFLDFFKYKNGVYPLSKRSSFTSKPIIPNFQSRTKKVARYNLAINQQLFSGYILDEKNAKYYIKELNKFKPESLDGLTSSIYYISKYILQNNIKLEFTPKAIFPTAETLLKEQKETIEKAFNCRVFNQYASGEGAPFICEDRNQELIVSNETGIFEFYKIDSEENLYEMIVTSLINKNTPIVRYKIGDAVRLDSSEPEIDNFKKKVKVEEILGRSTEYLIGANNKRVSSVNLVNSIRQALTKDYSIQFIQNEKSSIIINIYYDEKFYHELLNLKKRIEEKTGINISINLTKKFKKTNNGKVKFIINNVNE